MIHILEHGSERVLEDEPNANPWKHFTDLYIKKQRAENTIEICFFYLQMDQHRIFHLLNDKKMRVGIQGKQTFRPL